MNGAMFDITLKKQIMAISIDWESSVGYNEVSPSLFNATRPKYPVRVRVWAGLSDYYNYKRVISFIPESNLTPDGSTNNQLQVNIEVSLNASISKKYNDLL